MKKLLLLCFVLCIGLFGCGNETSGTLSLSAPASNGGVVTTKAKFTPTSGSVLPNQDIYFKWYTVGVTSNDRTSDLLTSGKTDSTGTVSSSYTLPTARTESVYVFVSASTGDLTNIEGIQSVLVVP